MNDTSIISSQLIESVKTIDKEQMNIAVMLMNFSSKFDDAHQAFYAEAMTLIKARFEDNIMFIGAWLTTPNPQLSKRLPIDVLASSQGTKDIIYLIQNEKVIF